jgi:hypothetical protein
MHAIQAAIYLLCFATSLFCLVLLARSYMKNRTKLLLWSALCFVGLAISNLLMIDVVFLPTQVDLLALRNLSSLAAVAVLLYGFIWETD